MASGLASTSLALLWGTTTVSTLVLWLLSTSGKPDRATIDSAINFRYLRSSFGVSLFHSNLHSLGRQNVELNSDKYGATDVANKRVQSTFLPQRHTIAFYFSRGSYLLTAPRLDSTLKQMCIPSHCMKNSTELTVGKNQSLIFVDCNTVG